MSYMLTFFTFHCKFKNKGKKKKPFQQHKFSLNAFSFFQQSSHWHNLWTFLGLQWFDENLTYCIKLMWWICKIIWNRKEKTYLSRLFATRFKLHTISVRKLGRQLNFFELWDTRAKPSAQVNCYCSTKHIEAMLMAKESYWLTSDQDLAPFCLLGKWDFWC